MSNTNDAVEKKIRKEIVFFIYIKLLSLKKKSTTNTLQLSDLMHSYFTAVK